MALLNSIGDFLFLDLAGGVVLPQADGQPIQRPGVDGTAIKLLGVHGREFTLRSRVDAFSVNDAQLAAINYQAIVNDGNAYNVIQYGYDYGNESVAFRVLRVEARVRARWLFKGGLFPPSLGFIEANWTLLAIPV